MSRSIEIRVKKKEIYTFADIAKSHTFFDSNGLLSMAIEGRRAVILATGEVWKPEDNCVAYPVDIAIIRV